MFKNLQQLFNTHRLEKYRLWPTPFIILAALILLHGLYILFSSNELKEPLGEWMILVEVFLCIVLTAMHIFLRYLFSLRFWMQVLIELSMLAIILVAEFI